MTMCNIRTMPFLSNKGHSSAGFLGKKVVQPAFMAKKHVAPHTTSRVPIIDTAIGRGDMGKGIDPIHGNTHGAVANGQRDSAPSDMRANAFTRTGKRSARNTLESNKRNKRD